MPKEGWTYCGHCPVNAEVLHPMPGTATLVGRGPGEPAGWQSGGAAVWGSAALSKLPLPPPPAIALLKDKDPGAFLIRDSHSFQGAYGLALKVATPPPSAQPWKGTQCPNPGKKGNGVGQVQRRDQDGRHTSSQRGGTGSDSHALERIPTE